MPAKVEDARAITAGLADHRRPAVAPGGAWIAYEVAIEGGEPEVIVAALDGRFGRALGGAGARRDAVFLAPGLIALCEERRAGRAAIVTLDLESGKRATKLEHPDSGLAAPALAERRGRLAFTGDLARTGGEVLLERDLAAPAGGAAPIDKLTEKAGQVERRPAYSPDGFFVAFEVHASAHAKEHALALFDVKRRRTDVLAFEPGARYGRPVFVDERRILFERVLADGRAELALCEVASKKLAPVETGMPARDPALFKRPDGGLGVAFAGQPGVRGAREDPKVRWEIVVGRLRL